MKPVTRFADCVVAALFIAVCGLSNPARAADADPLRPIDASSPRATLRGFTEIVDQTYLGMVDLLKSYAASDRLYLSPEERRRQIENLSGGTKAAQFLDTSRISPVLKDSVAIERVLELKEILDRIELPAFDAIPDRDATARSSAKRWRLPGTEIDTVLIENGPRAGEWLVSADTVDRLPEFYRRVEHLPYKFGPAKQLADAYRALSSNRTTTIFQAYSGSPLGLEAIVPTRWMLRLPGWAKARIAGVALWQWFGFVFGIAAGALFVFGCHRLGRRFARGREDEAGPGWHALLTPLGVIIVAGLLVPRISVVFHIGGSPRIIAAFVQTIALYLSAAWLAVIGAGLLGEAIAASEHLRRGSLDSQLSRLGMRLAGVAIAIGLLMRAGDELGFPAYSVLAGLGVGGLAVALAARDSLANLFGSVLIMFEKPFRVGHRIRVGSSEGVVEDVGYRSTRIRTSDNSLISIPNDTVVNATVENLTLRTMFRQRLLVQVTYDTPRAKLEALADGIRQLIGDHSATNKNNFHVRFNDFGESSLNILVIFYLIVPNYAEELKDREDILLRIMDLATNLDVEFAFPTRTLHIETVPTIAGPGSSGVDGRGIAGLAHLEPAAAGRGPGRRGFPGPR